MNAVQKLTSQKMSTYVRYCPSCACRDACQEAYGVFWRDKSGGAVGCNKPFDGKADGRLPPPAHRDGMTPDEEWAWFDEYLRRCAISIERRRERFKDWSPRERETAVMMKHPGRFKRRFTT